MRELKFRAWIKDYIKESSIPKSMRADYGFPKMVTPLCVYSENGFEYQEGLGYRKISKKDYDFVLMQFTGLKDCEGREIYEGDIISEDPSIWNGHFYYFIVNMRDGCWEAKSTIPHDKNARGCLLFNIKNPKVEGNIYENPELIKD